MKYKRLTTRSKDGYVHYNCSKKDMKDCGLYYNCGECHKSTEVLYRLAELEDKMENGTLIGLPCKVGDTVYRITQSYRGNEKITIYTVKEIIVDKKGVTYLTIALKGASSITCKVNVDSVFLTREEAEAKLKELQE